MQAWRSLFTYDLFAPSALNVDPALRGLKEETSMANNTNKITRKNSPPIKVYCLPEERELIESLSVQAGLSISTYLREVGQGYRIQGITDVEQVRELVRVNGDLGRLGGLLKLWLSNDAKVANVGVNTILAVLNRIEATQDQMSSLMESILRPRADQ